MDRPPPLNAIRVFAAVARLSSIKDAAAVLSVTPGAVSRQIQALESDLGVALFERRFREIALTQMGRLFYEQVGPALAGIDDATRRIRELARGCRRSVVRVDATPTFALHWLIPRLAEFHARHPEIEIRLGTSVGPIERRREAACDLHIRRDPAHFGGLAGAPFMTEYSAVVCSTRLPLERRPASPAALADSPLVQMSTRPDLWPKWFAAQGLDEHRALRRIELDDTILAIQAVIEGLGVGFIPRLFIAGLLESGALEVLPGTAPLATGAYHLLVAADTPPAPVGVFADWLKRRAADDQR